MVASEVGHPGVRIGMRSGHCLAMERAGAFSRVAINCGELIFSSVVERVLKTPFQVPTPFGLVFHIPTRSTSKRLFGRDRIAITQLRLYLVQVHELVMRRYLQTDPAGRVSDL